MNRARISKHANLQLRLLMTLNLGLDGWVADLTPDSAFAGPLSLFRDNSGFFAVLKVATAMSNYGPCSKRRKSLQVWTIKKRSKDAKSSPSDWEGWISIFLSNIAPATLFTASG